MLRRDRVGIAVLAALVLGSSVAVGATPEDEAMLRDIQQAITQYGNATGYYPPTLDDLHPQYLSQLPRTISGEHFIYNNQTGYVASPGARTPGAFAGPSGHEPTIGTPSLDIAPPGPREFIADYAGFFLPLTSNSCVFNVTNC